MLTPYLLRTWLTLNVPAGSEGPGIRCLWRIQRIMLIVKGLPVELVRVAFEQRDDLIVIVRDCKATDSSNKRIVITNRFGAVRRQVELDRFGCAALPANMQSQPLLFRAFDDGDIPDQQAEHALAVTRCGGWSGPEPREVSAQLQDLPFLFGRDGTQCLPL